MNQPLLSDERRERGERKVMTASHLPRRFVPTEQQHLWSGKLVAGRDVHEA